VTVITHHVERIASSILHGNFMAVAVAAECVCCHASNLVAPLLGADSFIRFLWSLVFSFVWCSSCSCLTGARSLCRRL